MSSRARPHSQKGQTPSNDIDRISNLPTSLLCHILSFLPTEDAVATSFLSTRWRFLWRDIHNLTFFASISSRFFGRNIKGRKIKFAHFVNKVLLFLNGQSIDKFYLEIEEYCEWYDITTWMASAVARKPRVLEFCLECTTLSDGFIQLPCSIFTCETLEVLVLRCDVSLNIPSLVRIPKLKKLHLEGVNYRCDESVRKLISGLPSLETLYIDRKAFDNVVNFTISSPTLRNLTFLFDDPCYFPEELGYKLEINAPALRYLDLSDCLSRDFSVADLCSLDEANVLTKSLKDEENFPVGDYDQYSRAVVKLLQGVYNVKHLLLAGETLEAFRHAGLVPSFPRLTQLNVEAQFCGWSALLKLVKGLDKLEFLSFTQYFVHENEHATCWSEPEKVPLCFSSCLKRMVIHRFKGAEYELAMVAYILKNAKVLRSMTITVFDPYDIEDKFQLLQKVAKFPRGSEECELTFS